MGLFDYVKVRDARFVCSEGHDLSDEEFQSKDFGCQMGEVGITDGHVYYTKVCLDTPSADGSRVEIYCTCTKCPAFVQFGTGNKVGCSVSFEIELDGDVVKSVTRTSPSTVDFLRNEPKQRHMKRCEGPMPYREAQWRHRHYREQRKAEYAEFDTWAKARSKALKAGKPWPWTLAIGEYPDENA